MPTLPTRPFLAIYVVWHPGFVEGSKLADMLYRHYRRDLYENVAGGTGLSVVFRYQPMPGTTVPLGINPEDSDTSAVIVLIDDILATDKDWLDYVHGLIDQAEQTGLRVRVFPVTITQQAIRSADLMVQAVRWDKWEHFDILERARQLTSELSYEFCRMVRHYLEHLQRPAEPVAALEKYLRKVTIFLSYSTHDDRGEVIALAMRDHIHRETGLSSFFNVHDIPAGLNFACVLEHFVRVSAVVAIHTDSYSSREWCRREIIEAKRHSVPLVIANCIANFEERAFPYMGNVPVVRMETDVELRIPHVIGRLLDEVLKDFLWRCRLELTRGHPDAEHAIFLPRPPELIALASSPRGAAPGTAITLVYPDPPLGAEEASLFESIVPSVTIRSYTEWLAAIT